MNIKDMVIGEENIKRNRKIVLEIKRLKKEKKIKAKQTAHNRSVYASPPVGGSGYEKPQSGYALCAVFLRHIFLRP
jgi:hypothetical protein